MGIIANWEEYILDNKLGFVKYHYGEHFRKLNSHTMGLDTLKLLRQLIHEQKEYYNKTPNIKKLEKAFDEIQPRIYQLKEKGVKVIFFEMPVNCELQNARLFKECEKEINNRFPVNNYPFLNQESCREYETTDGLHLKAKSAIKCTRLFLSTIHSL